MPSPGKELSDPLDKNQHPVKFPGSSSRMRVTSLRAQLTGRRRTQKIPFLQWDSPHPARLESPPTGPHLHRVRGGAGWWMTALSLQMPLTLALLSWDWMGVVLRLLSQEAWRARWALRRRSLTTVLCRVMDGRRLIPHWLCMEKVTLGPSSDFQLTAAPGCGLPGQGKTCSTSCFLSHCSI